MSTFREELLTPVPEKKVTSRRAMVTSAINFILPPIGALRDWAQRTVQIDKMPTMVVKEIKSAMKLQYRAGLSGSVVGMAAITTVLFATGLGAAVGVGGIVGLIWAGSLVGRLLATAIVFPISKAASDKAVAKSKESLQGVVRENKEKTWEPTINSQILRVSLFGHEGRTFLNAREKRSWKKDGEREKRMEPGIQMTVMRTPVRRDPVRQKNTFELAQPVIDPKPLNSDLSTGSSIMLEDARVEPPAPKENIVVSTTNPEIPKPLFGSPAIMTRAMGGSNGVSRMVPLEMEETPTAKPMSARERLHAKQAQQRVLSKMNDELYDNPTFKKQKALHAKESKKTEDDEIDVRNDSYTP